MFTPGPISHWKARYSAGFEEQELAGAGSQAPLSGKKRV